MISTSEKPLEIQRRGMLIVLSSPSGAGKSSLANKCRSKHPDLSLSVSLTTRLPRPGEVEGQHYYFVSKDDFFKKQANGELLEWAEVFGNYYATPAAPVVKALDEGKDFLFDLDWQGTQQLAARYVQDLVRVFILPPNAEQLHKRLINRAQDSDETIRGRMAKAGEELSHWPEYDYVIVNDNFDTALEQLEAVIVAERIKRERQTGLSAFIRDLQNKLL